MQQDALAGLVASIPPSLMVLIEILLNRNDINRLDTQLTSLRSEMIGKADGLRNEMTGQIGSIRSDMTGQIGTIRGEMNGQIGALRSELASFRAQVHGDLSTIMTINHELDKRVTAVEERSSQ